MYYYGVFINTIMVVKYRPPRLRVPLSSGPHCLTNSVSTMTSGPTDAYRRECSTEVNLHKSWDLTTLTRPYRPDKRISDHVDSRLSEVYSHITNLF